MKKGLGRENQREESFQDFVVEVEMDHNRERMLMKSFEKAHILGRTND